MGNKQHGDGVSPDVATFLVASNGRVESFFFVMPANAELQHDLHSLFQRNYLKLTSIEPHSALTF